MTSLKHVGELAASIDSHSILIAYLLAIGSDYGSNPKESLHGHIERGAGRDCKLHIVVQQRSILNVRTDVPCKSMAYLIPQAESFWRSTAVVIPLLRQITVL